MTTAPISGSRLALMIAFLVAMLAVVPACEIDDDEGDTVDMTQNDTNTNQTNRTVSFTSAGVLNPAEVTVTRTSTVTWTNNYDADMVIDFSDNDSLVDSGAVPPGGTFSATFNQAGSFNYIESNTGEAGLVIVQ